MIVEELVKQVKEIPEKTDYWFVRTDYGQYFDTYYENGFIAIGWNNITLEELKNPNDDEKIRKKLLISEKLDSTKAGTKGTLTGIINKLQSFVNLKKGDIIVMPSRNSSRYAFGIVQSTQVDIDKGKDCDYYKRKKVKWVTVKNTSQLDPNFFTMRFTQHTISRIDDYSPFIDNVISSLYRKNNNTHFVLDIKTTKDINVNSLISLIDNIQILINQINKDFNLGEQIDNNSIRLHLQSPGQIEFKLPIGKSLITLAAILSLTCCNDDKQPIKSPELNTFVNVNQDTISKIKKSMTELEADKDKINAFK